MTRAEAAALARIEQTRLRATRVARLADLVADGSTIRAAAVTMGIGESTALAYWAEIRKGMEC